MTNQSIVSEKKTTGRMSTLTPVIIEALCDLVAKGNYNVTACNIVGVSEPTFYSWLQRGEEDIAAGVVSLFSYLSKSLKDAEGKAEAEMVERVRTAALPGVRSKTVTTGPKGTTVETHETGGDWLAAATFLERRQRERWGRPAPVQIVQNETKEIHITQVEIVLNQAGIAPMIEGEKVDRE